MLATIRIGPPSAIRTEPDLFKTSRRGRPPLHQATEDRPHHRPPASERPRMGRGADRLRSRS